MELLPKESSAEYNQKLKSLLATANLWGKEITGYALQVAVQDFMDKIGRLYLNYFQFHIEEANISAMDYQELLPKFVKVINLEYVYEKEHRLAMADNFDELWETACWARTNIEAFQAMCGNFAGHLDAVDLVAYMQDKKGIVRADRNVIPTHVPSTHWWWFADFEYKD